jgi:class 3 adenylate cyclase
VRMGFHTAEPHLSEEGYVGVGVHRAARICEAARGVRSWCRTRRRGSLRTQS